MSSNMEKQADMEGEGTDKSLEPLTEEQMQLQTILQHIERYIEKHKKEVEDAMKARSMMENGTTSSHQPLAISELPIITGADVVAMLRILNLLHANRERVPDEPSISKLISDFSAKLELASNVSVSNKITTQEILTTSGKRIRKLVDSRPVCDEETRLQSAPVPPEADDGIDQKTGKHKLLRPTPFIVIDSREDAHSLDLQKYCEKSPIVMIRGLVHALEIDLSHFSTQSLLKIATSASVEVRTQFRMAPDVNLDREGKKTWRFPSSRTYSSLLDYSQYLANEYMCDKEESKKLGHATGKHQSGETRGSKRRKLNYFERPSLSFEEIKVGRHVDLTDKEKYANQLQELLKMPVFCRLVANVEELEMNNAKVHMNVPGARNPAHHDNNDIASVNINIGPGDCEWFGVPFAFWGVVEKLCKKYRIDFLNGSYWPDIEELLAENVQVFRFTQKAGDMVYVGGGFMYWVQATGFCNNIAWDVDPVTNPEIVMAIHSYE